MRWVTRKPPKMLTEASTSATKPKRLRPARRRRRPPRAAVDADREQRADDDHGGDGVGHRHQRRVQRRRHRPDHVVADEDRQHEDREAEDEGVDRPAGRRRDAVAGASAAWSAKPSAATAASCAGWRPRPWPCRPRRAPPRPACSGVIVAITILPSAAKAGWTTAPSRVRLVALTSSSSQLTASVFFALSIIVSTKA